MNKIIHHVMSFLIGIFAAYNSRNFIGIPFEFRNNPWTYILNNYWLVVTIFFIGGYIIFYYTYKIISETAIEEKKPKKKKKN